MKVQPYVRDDEGTPRLAAFTRDDSALGTRECSADSDVSVLVPTMGRTDSLERTLRSLIASHSPEFEVIVLDQSKDCSSECMVAALNDPRLRYYRLPRPGKARALNFGASVARGEVLALTDDDTEVPGGWVSGAVSVVRSSPQIGVVFGAVEPAEHDRATSFIPGFSPDHPELVRSRLSMRIPGCGMGANMVVRRRVVAEIGGWDETLGPGGTFRSGDDWDFAYRAVRAGFPLMVSPDLALTHHGVRSLTDGSGSTLVSNYYFGVGAGLGKHIRGGDFGAVVVFCRTTALCLAGVGHRLVTRQRPYGLRRLTNLASGLRAGLVAGSR